MSAAAPALKRSPSAERREMESAFLQKDQARLAQRGVIAPSGDVQSASTGAATGRPGAGGLGPGGGTTSGGAIGSPSGG